MPPTLRSLRVTAPLSGKGTTGSPLAILAGGISSALLADIVAPGTYTSVTINAKGLVIAGTNPATGGTPTKVETLAHTGATTSVPGLSVTSSVVLHYRNGILQASDYYTISANTITPTTAGGGAYDDEYLITVFWP